MAKDGNYKVVAPKKMDYDPMSTKVTQNQSKTATARMSASRCLTYGCEAASK